jgi:hypothetical protein
MGPDDLDLAQFRIEIDGVRILLIETVTTKHTGEVQTPLTKTIEQQFS